MNCSKLPEWTDAVLGLLETAAADDDSDLFGTVVSEGPTDTDAWPRGAAIRVAYVELFNSATEREHRQVRSGRSPINEELRQEAALTVLLDGSGTRAQAKAAAWELLDAIDALVRDDQGNTDFGVVSVWGTKISEIRSRRVSIDALHGTRVFFTFTASSRT
jgi:hypothetical protein